MTDLMLTNELLNKTAREMKVTPKSMRYLYKFILMYLEKQIDSTDMCAFRFPHLGTMYINEQHVNDVIKDNQAILAKDEKNTAARKKELAYTYKKQQLEKYLENSGRPKGNSPHFKKEKIKSTKVNLGYTIEELQDVQNRIYKNDKT